jgi:hypothetical protein
MIVKRFICSKMDLIKAAPTLALAAVVVGAAAILVRGVDWLW